MNPVCRAPIRNSVNTDKPESVAHPVGLADVAPNPLPFQADVYDDSRTRGLSGIDRNSPTAGTPLEMNCLLPIRIAASTPIHASTGAVVLSFHRRMLESAPTNVAVSRVRRNPVSRALPRICRPSTSRSGTRRNGLTARRRARSDIERGSKPTSARKDAHASLRRPVKIPPTNSASVSSTNSKVRPGRRVDPVNVATVRMRCLALSMPWCRSGRRLASSPR